MKVLHEDQIHTPAFQKLCGYMWSDDATRPDKSGVWDYAVQCASDYDMQIVNHHNLPGSGVIFVGMCHLLEDIFESMPKEGSYIIVHRTNDRPFTQRMYEAKPPSVKHIYTVDCQVSKSDVSAIPFGNASINGEDEIIKPICEENFITNYNKIFVRYNLNPDTKHRNESLYYLKGKSFVTLIEDQISQDDFFRQCKAHKFTMALAGCGADASRQWSAIQLGSIPIVTDCQEMRHFEDMPLVYCPKDMNEITETWLDKQDVSGKSTERMRMSYWENHLQQKRNEYGI